MSRINFIAEEADGVWLKRWQSRAVPWVIRIQVLFIYLLPLILAGLTALVDVNSAVTLAVLLYLAILIKGGLSPARKLERFETRRAWSCLSDRAKTLLLGPKTVEINAEGMVWNPRCTTHSGDGKSLPD